MKRPIALACGVAGLGLGLGATAADAAPEPQPTLVLEPNPVAPGGRFTAVLEDFCTIDDAGALIQFVVDDGGGRIAGCAPNDLAIATLTAPSTPGEYDVRATLDTVLAVTTLVVQPEAPGIEEPLPDTGSDRTVVLTAIGGGLVVAGIVLFAAPRSRRSSAR